MTEFTTSKQPFAFGAAFTALAIAGAAATDVLLLPLLILVAVALTLRYQGTYRPVIPAGVGIAVGSFFAAVSLMQLAGISGWQVIAGAPSSFHDAVLLSWFLANALCVGICAFIFRSSINTYLWMKRQNELMYREYYTLDLLEVEPEERTPDPKINA